MKHPGPIFRAGLCLGLFFAPVAAQEGYSPEAAAIMQAEVAEACGTSQGNQITTNGFIEHDFTGDGARDLLIQHAEVSCAGGRRSGFCGAQVCLIDLWLRRDGQLVQADLEGLYGIITAISADPVPRITFYEHGGSTASIRWDGVGFAYRKETQ